MKTKIVMIIMAVALFALPTMAQQQEWKSTSTMQGTGSVYTPQAQQVGAVAAPSMATTTETYSPGRGPRRVEGVGGGSGSGSGLTNPGEGDPNSPIGDAVLPLMLMAVVFCGVIALRRKRNALNC